tara:strand:+ start:476 stop:1306 length:831 start_codon:yes stop_codon:yes gene_type:complete
MNNAIRLLSGIFLTLGLTACGTTFELPELGELQSAQASKMFAEARSEGPRRTLSTSAGEQRFRRVAPRIAQVGQQYCKAITADRKNFNCAVDVGIDREMKIRNAYFTYEGATPKIRISMPLLQDTASDDEVAFILSHEYGHLIGRHIEKQKQQALAGALILGAVTAAATAHNNPYGQYDPHAVNQSMEIGAAAGSMAYSQTYELESDTLGTRITKAAGYDPVKGAKFFARAEKARTTAGNLSFWGTHPPDEKRLATVLATVAEMDANVGLRLAKKK